MRSKQKVKRGIQVGCTNTEIIQQKEKGNFPFDNVLTGADDVQLFEHMQKPSLSDRTFVCNRCNIVFNIPNAHILTGETKEVIRNIINDAATATNEDILMTVPLPYNYDANTWQKNQMNTSECPKHIANNVRHLYQADGYPVKKYGLMKVFMFGERK